MPVRTSRGLRFYNPDYLKPLKDLQNTLEIYERHTESGMLYFAVKSGMLLQAIVLPMTPEYGKILGELLDLCAALQQTVEAEPAPDAEEEDADTEIEGQIGMEDEG